MNTAFIPDVADKEIIACQHAETASYAADAERMSAVLMLNLTAYERDTPVMSRTECLKIGESAVNALLNQIPVHLWRK